MHGEINTYYCQPIVQTSIRDLAVNIKSTNEAENKLAQDIRFSTTSLIKHTLSQPAKHSYKAVSIAVYKQPNTQHRQKQVIRICSVQMPCFGYHPLYDISQQDGIVVIITLPLTFIPLMNKVAWCIYNLASPI